ncbi:CAZyme family GH72 [Penicillium coprophilum]|uniref:CAZyme family GH72 n=1 Tax=Penicillium coprophilum TaxID=36646 RepID=UPI00238BE949|nr:CAZyme family GH72 [Penicillium coprophilum]KAJ5165608.1 CAZyme family GH72 [Penicillium coprophilum]
MAMPRSLFSSAVFAVLTVLPTFVYSLLEMLLPFTPVGENELLSGNHRFQTKDVGHVKDVSSSTATDVSADGTHTRTSIRPRSSNSTPHKQSRGSMAGISVGCTLGIIIIFASLFLYFSRRYKRNRRTRPSSSLPQRQTVVGSPSHDTPLAKLAHTDSPSQQSGSDSKTQDPDPVVIVHKGKEDV